jgi:hypothetical protein
MTGQASCIDCHHKHRPSECYHRAGRKRLLRERIDAATRELADLDAYDEKVASGEWQEPDTRYESWVKSQQRAKAAAHKDRSEGSDG